jgi:hypothetical protein
MMFVRAGVFIAVWLGVVVAGRWVAVQLEFVWFRLLLLALGWRTLGLLVCGLLLDHGHDMSRLLSLVCLLQIQRSGFAVDARMSKVFSKGIFEFIWVVALDVLPCVADLAIDRISVIVREVADTLDGVRFFLYRLLLVRDVLDRDGTLSRKSGLTGSHDLREQRRSPVCHNLDTLAMVWVERRYRRAGESRR